MGTIIWNAPARKSICNVLPGTVLTVQARIIDPSQSIVPDSRGIVPHVQYQANIPPIGTGGSVAFDPFDGRITNYNAGPMPTSRSNGEPADELTYDIDLGKPFPCPWAGTISLVGGVSTVPGTPVPMNVSFVASAPSDRPLIDSTITYRNVKMTSNIPVPRGAYAVTAGQLATVAFTTWNAATPHRMTLPAGAYPMPLGDLSMGNFSASAGTISDLTFYIAIG